MSLPPAKAVPLIPPFLPAPHAAAACIAVPPRRLRIFPLTGKQKPPRSLPDPDFADAQSTEQSQKRSEIIQQKMCATQACSRNFS